MPSWIRAKTSKMVMVGPTVGRSPPALCSGVTPVTTNISFTPYELGRAIAFCAFRHSIPKRHEPAHVRAMTALLDLHVEPMAPAFALESSAKTLKDFVSTYLAGVVATGLAYLFMEVEGYAWCGHFENASGGNPSAKKSPDFVFEHQKTRATALMESKGRLKAGGKAFATQGYDR